MQDAYTFHETYIVYQGRQIALNDRTLLLDGGMDDHVVQKYAYVYNDLKMVLQAVNDLGRGRDGETAGSGEANRNKKSEENEKTVSSERKKKDAEQSPRTAEWQTESMITVYIAPYVYWVDDPDAADTVCPEEGYGEPYGMVVDCDSLRLTGLTQEPSEVILAGNRGQSHGAKGNYTMFFFRVRHLEVANLTMGNYCSVDLEYPFRPTLSHRRRTEVITQAQLAKQSGDKLLARNCSFVSRLNLCPVCGGERCLYEHCHFESTDDALNGRAVYVECDFDFYGSRPLYDTKGSGAVFLGCRFSSRTRGDGVERKQYFTKESGPVTVVDCVYRCEYGEAREAREDRCERETVQEAREDRCEREVVRCAREDRCEREVVREAREDQCAQERIRKADARIAWTKYPRPGLKCYQYEMALDDSSIERWPPDAIAQLPAAPDSLRRFISISGDAAPETVCMEGKELLHGYRLEAEGGVVYNTFNLLRGADDWDPLGMKEYALRAGKDKIPTLLEVEIVGKVSEHELYAKKWEVKKEHVSCWKNMEGISDAGMEDDGKVLITGREDVGRTSVFGKEGVVLCARAFYYYGEEAKDAKISYRVSEQDRAYIQLTECGDGSCLVEGCNEDEIEHKVLITASTPEGLEGAVELLVCPKLMDVPDFIERPMMMQEEKGSCSIRYKLDLGKYEDRSIISWYRCEDAEGKYPVMTAVTRGKEPMWVYPLTRGDVGYYLMAQIVPCHVCSRQGDRVVLLTERPVAEDDILEQERETEDGIQKLLIATDFHSMPTTPQKKICPGFWTVDCMRPMDTMDFAKWEQSDGRKVVEENDGECAREFGKEYGRGFTKENDGECVKENDGERVKENGRECAKKNDGEGVRESGRECAKENDGEQGKEPWKYGRTGNGSVGAGLYQNVQGARLLYTPAEGAYGDMRLRLLADPAKTAGQGFGSAGQYMDICIKFDTITLTGYGVRVIRTKEASDGVRFVLIQYDHGSVSCLNEGVMASCYCTGCEIILSVKGQQLRVHVESKAEDILKSKCRYAAVVDMTAKIEENSYGGIAVWHTGTPGTGGWQNTTMLHYLEVSVKENIPAKTRSKF